MNTTGPTSFASLIPGPTPPLPPISGLTAANFPALFLPSHSSSSSSAPSQMNAFVVPSLSTPSVITSNPLQQQVLLRPPVAIQSPVAGQATRGRSSGRRTPQRGLLTATQGHVPTSSIQNWQLPAHSIGPSLTNHQNIMPGIHSSRPATNFHSGVPQSYILRPDQSAAFSQQAGASMQQLYQQQAMMANQFQMLQAHPPARPPSRNQSVVTMHGRPSSNASPSPGADVLANNRQRLKQLRSMASQAESFRNVCRELLEWANDERAYTTELAPDLLETFKVNIASTTAHESVN